MSRSFGLIKDQSHARFLVLVILTVSVAHCRIQAKITEEDFNYVVKHQGRDVPCILANMSISIRVRYTRSQEFADIIVPSDATVEGFCDYSMSKMVLTWVEPKGKQESNSLALYLSRNSDQFSLFFVEADVYFDKKNFPNASSFADKRFRFLSNFNLDVLVGPPENTIYQCMDDLEVVMSDNALVTINQVTLIPFNEEKDLNLKQEYTCPEKITTTEPPTTTPHASENDYMYVVRYNDKNAACILANMTISLKIRYKTINSETKETILKVPSEKVNVYGTCDCKNRITLVWSEDNGDAETGNRIELLFLGDDRYFYLRSIWTNIYLDEKNFPNANESRFRDGIFEEEIFRTLTSSMQRCDVETVIGKNDVQVTFNNVALIAFNTDPDVSNKLEFKCDTLPKHGYWTALDIAALTLGIIFVSTAIIIVVSCVRPGTLPWFRIQKNTSDTHTFGQTSTKELMQNNNQDITEEENV